ncbi:hypothetical protein Tco_0659613 [Tanacetum coccineum]
MALRCFGRCRYATLCLHQILGVLRSKALSEIEHVKSLKDRGLSRATTLFHGLLSLLFQLYSKMEDESGLWSGILAINHQVRALFADKHLWEAIRSQSPEVQGFSSVWYCYTLFSS